MDWLILEILAQLSIMACDWRAGWLAGLDHVGHRRIALNWPERTFWASFFSRSGIWGKFLGLFLVSAPDARCKKKHASSGLSGQFGELLQ